MKNTFKFIAIAANFKRIKINTIKIFFSLQEKGQESAAPDIAASSEKRSEKEATGKRHIYTLNLLIVRDCLII